MNYFGEHLKMQRELHGLSQEELAFKARLGKRTIEKYENGEQIPDTQTILKLSTVLDIPASELMEREIHQTGGIDSEIEQLVQEIGIKKAKLILRKAKEFTEDDFLRVMQMAYDLK
ncbi:helix-turn-helix domain-containing protein [Bacillus coahuilensis]|nr:helix-turn-helix transcriptional regulator [Bacillus coahuilensis]